MSTLQEIPAAFRGSSRLGQGRQPERGSVAPVWVPPFHGKGRSFPLYRGWRLRSKEAREAKSPHALGQAGQRADLVRPTQDELRLAPGAPGWRGLRVS